MKARIAASAVLAVGVALGTAGCNLVAPQATTIMYDPSDGVGATIGDVSLRNVFVVSDDGEIGNLVLTAVNNGDADAEVEVEYETASGTADAAFSAPVGSTIIGPADGGTVLLEGLDTPPGSLLKVYFQYGDAEGKEVLVPVLTSALEPYSTLAPTTGPTSTSVPPQATSTPAVTPTEEPDTEADSTGESTE